MVGDVKWNKRQTNTVGKTWKGAQENLNLAGCEEFLLNSKNC